MAQREYEETCLKAYESISQARQSIAAYMDRYGQHRRIPVWQTTHPTTRTSRRSL
ncbi:hypothetical protein DP49_5705 [Burkholderia pseudomallei]|nr:hypothetical protein DP49_5705 [Burkholderia pseudomallei]